MLADRSLGHVQWFGVSGNFLPARLLVSGRRKRGAQFKLGWHVCRTKLARKMFFEALFFAGPKKIPQNSRQISRKISLPKIKKNHRRASAGAQGESLRLGGFDDFGGSGEHLALLLLILQNNFKTVPRGNPYGFDCFGSCGGFSRLSLPNRAMRVCDAMCFCNPRCDLRDSKALDGTKRGDFCSAICIAGSHLCDARYVFTAIRFHCDLCSRCGNPLRCRPRCKHHCDCDAAMW